MLHSVQPQNVGHSEVEQYTNAKPGLRNGESKDLKGEACYSIHEKTSRLLDVVESCQLEVRYCAALLVFIGHMKLEEHLHNITHLLHMLHFIIVYTT